MTWRLQLFFICACTAACLSVTAGQPMSSKEPFMTQPKSPKKPSSELLGVYFGGFGGWIYLYSWGKVRSNRSHRTWGQLF